MEFKVQFHKISTNGTKVETYSPLFSKEPYTSKVEELKLGSSSKIDDPSTVGAYEANMKMFTVQVKSVD